MTESKVDFTELHRRGVDFEVVPTIKPGSKGVPGPDSARVNGHPLSKLLKAGTISQRQHDAGERLMLDHLQATINPSPVLDGTPVTKSAGSRTILDCQLDAKKRVDIALQCVGKLGRSMLAMFIINEATQAELGKEFDMHRNHIPGALKLALNDLADHYGLP